MMMHGPSEGVFTAQQVWQIRIRGRDPAAGPRAVGHSQSNGCGSNNWPSYWTCSQTICCVGHLVLSLAHIQPHICINNAVIYSANARAVAWECVGRVHKTADWTRPFLTPQATSAELPTKMATFGPFCPFLHVTFSFRAV